MRRTFILLFATLALTTGCDDKIKSALERGAYAVIGNEVVKQADNREEKLNALPITEELKSHYREHLKMFRVIGSEMMLTTSRDEFKTLAGALIGNLHDVWCDIGRNDGELKAQLTSVFGSFDALLKPLVSLFPKAEGGFVSLRAELCP